MHSSVGSFSCVSQMNIKLEKLPEAVSITESGVDRHAQIIAALFSGDLSFEFVSMSYVLGAKSAKS